MKGTNIRETMFARTQVTLIVYLSYTSDYSYEWYARILSHIYFTNSKNITSRLVGYEPHLYQGGCI